jgi:hypothetical protein
VSSTGLVDLLPQANGTLRVRLLPPGAELAAGLLVAGSLNADAILAELLDQPWIVSGWEWLLPSDLGLAESYEDWLVLTDRYSFDDETGKFEVGTVWTSGGPITHETITRLIQQGYWDLARLSI